MQETAYTKSTSKETMAISPIVLRETGTTRLVFEPLWVDASVSDHPLRGGFRFQRKGPRESWIEFESKTLVALHKDEEYKLNLQPEEICKLLSSLSQINEQLSKCGHIPGSGSFTLSRDNAEGIFLQISQIKNREWVIQQLKLLENESFENLGSAIGRARLENIIIKFEANLSNTDEKFWQDFFNKNTWILQQAFAFPVMYLAGESYLGGKNSKGRQGFGGSATDFLFKNGSNGSFAVVEIKTPGCPLVGGLYRGEKDSEGRNELCVMHGDLTGGIVQLENQIYIAIENFKTTLGADYDGLNHLNPTGVLIAGNYEAMTDIQRKSFELFRKALGKNQVYTFDEVLEKLKLLKSVYEN